MNPQRRTASRRGRLVLLGLVAILAGCATSPPSSPVGDAVGDAPERFIESPVPDGPWRPHVLLRCAGPEDSLPRRAATALRESNELFGFGEGGDAIVALELYLQGGGRREGMLLLTLAQLYVLAGQGAPDLVPFEGPAADTGDWPENRRRFLARAEALLDEARVLRADDAVVEYLWADACRARGDTASARTHHDAALTLCTLPSSFAVLDLHQHLGRHAAVFLDGPAPEYPDEAARRGVQGVVVQDLLVTPGGRVAQVVGVAVPNGALGRAAAAAHGRARYRPARIGKYPIWSWVRVESSFNLTAD